MRKHLHKLKILGVLIVSLMLLSTTKAKACSTFMLHKGGKLIFGHNLNEGDIGVPGILFVNKRSVFKMGRSLNEMMFKEVTKPSKLSWISRYGSITFNNFGRDLPDGGMNEAGFYIWEMNEASDYPKGDTLHKLSQMGWMQYLLDNCSTIDEAFELTKGIEIDGWTWHYFLADASGRCASLAFIDGKMKINRDQSMPVKALLNTPYDREMEVAKYYENFGGLYEVELNNPEVPRFVKTAYLTQKYESSQDIIDYGFYMLDKIQVSDKPEWSIVFDPLKKQVFFKTRLHPAIKHLSLNNIEFSSQSGPCLIQNIDVEKGGDIKELLHPYDNKEMNGLLTSLIDLVGEGFFRMGGLEPLESVNNLSNHWQRAEKEENQFFKGKWETEPKNSKEGKLGVQLFTNKNAVFGEVTASDGSVYKIDHLMMIDKNITLTFLTQSGRMLELKGKFINDQLNASVYGTESYLGEFDFYSKK